MKAVLGFGSYSVKDVNTAQKFYTKTLNLDAKIDEKMGIMNIAMPGGGKIIIYPKGDAHQPASFTVLNLIVANIEASVDELVEKGVVFEQYDTEYSKTDTKGIARTGESEDSSAIAWFKDPDGNTLSLIEG